MTNLSKNMQEHLDACKDITDNGDEITIETVAGRTGKSSTNVRKTLVGLAKRKYIVKGDGGTFTLASAKAEAVVAEVAEDLTDVVEVAEVTETVEATPEPTPEPVAEVTETVEATPATASYPEGSADPTKLPEGHIILSSRKVDRWERYTADHKRDKVLGAKLTEALNRKEQGISMPTEWVDLLGKCKRLSRQWAATFQRKEIDAAYIAAGFSKPEWPYHNPSKVQQNIARVKLAAMIEAKEAGTLDADASKVKILKAGERVQPRSEEPTVVAETEGDAAETSTELPQVVNG
jgi:hypothetical protein